MARMHRIHQWPGGFTFVEVVVALAVLVTALAGVGSLLLQGGRLAAHDRRAPVAMAAAAAKLEQLRGLLWTFDDLGVARSDLSSDTSAAPPVPMGGSGLDASPGGTLEADVAGWVDYIDDRGKPLGAGSAGRLSAAFARRWAVIPMDATPDVLELHVCVVPANGVDAPRAAALACLATARARR
jgi:prepilin-type N-terminal cleavage/methylation domain-containing protein